LPSFITPLLAVNLSANAQDNSNVEDCMNLYKNIFVFTLMLSTHTSFGMQQPTQKKEIAPSLGGLPPDLKRHLFPYLFTGAPAWVARSISTFAILNKECNGIANDENRMLSCLRMYFHNAPYRAHAVDVGRQLQSRTGALPVMHTNSIKNLLSVMEKQLINGQQLFNCCFPREARPLFQQLLADEHLDLNWNRSRFCESPLHLALFHKSLYCRNNSDVAQALLDAGANPNSALQIHQSIEMYQKLLAYGADPNYRSKMWPGMTPLMYAAVWPNAAYIKLLLQAGADLDLKDADGGTARDYARVRLNGSAQRLKIYRMLGRAHYERKQKLLAQKKQQESS
jgi:hypothetical protein